MPPGAGGETLLANTRLAYSLLPRALRERIDGLQALHVYDFAYSREKYADRIREADCSPPFYFEGKKKLYKPGCI